MRRNVIMASSCHAETRMVEEFPIDSSHFPHNLAAILHHARRGHPMGLMARQCGPNCDLPAHTAECPDQVAGQAVISPSLRAGPFCPVSPAAPGKPGAVPPPALRLAKLRSRPHHRA